MNTNKLSLRRNVIYLAVVQGSNYLLPLLTFPYLVRTLGPENFGIFGFCQATMLYMIMFVEYGFNLTATQSIAKAADSKDKVTSIFLGGDIFKNSSYRHYIDFLNVDDLACS